MSKTGKIFKESSNIYQDQARLLFNYYEQAAERIVRQEEAIEERIRQLEEDRDAVELKMSDIWKWFLTVILFFMYFVRKKEYTRQIEAIDEEIARQRESFDNIFRDYKVTKMGVAYVPVAQQMAYEDKCFVVDYTDSVPYSRVSVQMSRQNDLLVRTMSNMEQLTKDAPIVESSEEAEPIDTNDYSLSIQEITQSDYVGQLDRAIRTISYCMNDTEVKSVDLPLVTDSSDYLRFLKEFTTSDAGGHPIINVFDGHRYDGAVNVFEHYGLERQLSEAFARQVPLKSGGYLVIDETEALIAVDVNTGHYKGKGSQEDAILEVNLEAVEEVARQLRLRNIGGLVILDLIDMKSRKHQKQVYRALKDALKRDRARTNVLEISELGLLEMSRQRHEESILSMLSSTCPCCDGHGVVKSPLAVSIELQRQLTSILRKAEAEKRPIVPKIVIAPAVMQRLRTEDAQILAELQARHNTKLTFVSELHRHPETYSILDAESGQVLYSSGAGRPAV